MTNSSSDQYSEIDFSPLAALAEGEVVTRSRVRDIRLPSGKVLALITLDNGRDHNRPNTLGPTTLKELGATLDDAEERVPRRARSRRSASPASSTSWPPAPTCPTSRGSGRRTTRGSSRSSGTTCSASFRAGRAVLRVRQRARARRRTRDRAQLDLSDGGCLGRGDRAARGVPRHHPGLGRGVPAAEPHRHRERPRGRHLEPAQAEPDAEAAAGVRLRDRRRDLPRRQLPGGFAAVGRRRARRLGQGAPQERARQDRAPHQVAHRDQDGARHARVEDRHGAEVAVRCARAARQGQERHEGRGLRPRGRGAGRTRDGRPVRGIHVCVRSRAEAGRSVRSGRPTRSSPRRSRRSGSSAPASWRASSRCCSSASCRCRC